MSQSPIAASEVSLVVTDLDGTLWGAGEVIHDRTVNALRALEERGVPLLVATGRRARGAAGPLARIGISPPAVLLDGAIGRQLPDGPLFHSLPFDPDDASQVLDAFASFGLEPCVYVSRPAADVVVGRRPSTHPRHLEYIGPWLAREDLHHVVASEPVYAFGIVGGDAEELGRVAMAIGEAGAGVPTPEMGLSGATLMVRPTGTSKWEGVLAYCDDQGLDPNRVLAVGNGENDLELLGGAAVSCVVADACDSALALADHVIEPALDGGWSGILSLL